MYLTEIEKRMLDGGYGELVRKCMKVLVTLGDIYGAERMIEIKNVHSPGVSYRVSGDAGLNYVKEASEQGCFRIMTTLNTIGIDYEDWEKIGFPREFSLRQIELIKAYEKMGAISCNTCTPFLAGNIPLAGEHVAWGESSAIAFVNSVLGARTNREGGPTALAAAVTGRVPAYGYHLDENRRGKYVFKIEMDLKDDSDYAALGYYAGKYSGKDVPVFEGITNRPTLENLKALSAAVASSGAVALYHIVGITPEAPTRNAVIDKAEMLKFGPAEYREVTDKFTHPGKIDFVVIGCPHCSIMEFRQLAQLLAGKKIKTGMWVCSSRQVKLLAEKMGYAGIIREAGAEIICDTCPVLCPTLEQRGYRTLATNSAKMSHYAPGLWNVEANFMSMVDCVRTALAGEWRGKN